MKWHSHFGHHGHQRSTLGFVNVYGFYNSGAIDGGGFAGKLRGSGSPLGADLNIADTR